MSEANQKRDGEIRRIQAEIDQVERLPPELALALVKANALCHFRVDEVLQEASRRLSAASTDEDREKAYSEIAEAEKARLDAAGERYDFDLNSVGWTSASEFLREFSRWIRKRCSPKSTSGHSVPTAAACYNPRTEEVEVVYNPRFLASLSEKPSSLNAIEPGGIAVNEHEMMHLILNHVTSRRREPNSLHNISADLAINSLISRGDTPSRLPSKVLLPGIRMKGPLDPSYPPEVKEAKEKLDAILMGLPQEECTEFYFQEIRRLSEKQGYSWGKKGMKVPGAKNPGKGKDGEGNGDEDEGWVLWHSDSHDGWDDIPEELREIVDSKIRHALQQACSKADSTSSGWGNIPASLREEIRAYCFGSVDWRALLRNWTGMRQSGGRSRSIRKLDRRVPGAYPGLKRARNPWIDVYVDQSGSVDDAQLSRIFGALDGCARHVSFRVWPFDVGVAESEMFVWKRGTKPNVQRVRGGGTDFDSVIAHANSPNRRGQSDGVIICTDGGCSKPPPSRVKLAWLLTPGNKLMFEPYDGELVVNMSDKDDVQTGSW